MPIAVPKILWYVFKLSLKLFLRKRNSKASRTNLLENGNGTKFLFEFHLIASRSNAVDNGVCRLSISHT